MGFWKNTTDKSVNNIYNGKTLKSSRQILLESKGLGCFRTKESTLE